MMRKIDWRFLALLALSLWFLWELGPRGETSWPDLLMLPALWVTFVWAVLYRRMFKQAHRLYETHRLLADGWRNTAQMREELLARGSMGSLPPPAGCKDPKLN